MYILISNDDGYQSPGLICLKQALEKIAEVFVVAPDRDRSGASNSLTLDQPIRAHKVADNLYSVNGTPTDCVHVALTNLLTKAPDMVVSGINLGANLGDDVLYSGTVAAAMEGRSLGYSSIAISMMGNPSGIPDNLSAAAQVVADLIIKLQKNPLPQDSILNVNLPDIPYEKIQGIKVTRLGCRHPTEGVIKTLDPRGRVCYWIGPPGSEQDAGEGTDFYAIKQNYVSITPLRIDLTRYEQLSLLEQWLND